ncbi:hypothetical protein [Caballeronia sp. LZ003]|uniref:hypothetical protein n=1 Tax=unclassified Caballeronia TaxID=2646786 RepID=UPI0038574335
MPLTGRYQVIWGEDGQHQTVLEPLDLFAVPPGVYRAFRNVSDHDAKMLVLGQGEKDQVMNDIYYDKSLGVQVTAAFGPEIWNRFRSIGLRLAPTE